jgi:hypothetical protein
MTINFPKNLRVKDGRVSLDESSILSASTIPCKDGVIPPENGQMVNLSNTGATGFDSMRSDRR